MVGANALLGKCLRGGLAELARKKESGWTLAPLEDGERYPTADPDDPIREHDDPAADAKDDSLASASSSAQRREDDDPARDAKEGILSRDGGHFEAQFESGAKDFAQEAARYLRKNLPGLRFRISIDQKPILQTQTHLSTELPVLAPCEWTGRGLASCSIEQGDERPAVSLDIKARHDEAKNTENSTEDGTAKDIASLLSAKTKLQNLDRAQELKELVGNGYLALIHADGNGVGSGLGQGKPDHERAAFFHRNRVLLRRAVAKAIDTHCPDTGRAPLIPLMLGGDDLLLLARAEIALPFIVTMCATLDDLQKNTDGFKLTLGVGVVFAPYTVPIYRLHEVAEQLASSAKRRFRGLKGNGEPDRSVVDWAVFSTAWVDDPELVRRRDWLCGKDNELRVLSQRPVDVLGDGLDSLQGLVKGAEKLENAPRSQLRYLVEQLSRGRTLSELTFAELSKEARAPLAEAGIENPWRQTSNSGAWLTSLLDLVEVLEIPRLGRKTEPTGPSTDSSTTQKEVRP
jgi:hypothetical protein